MTLANDAAARAVLDPAKLTWVVVGDRTVVLPQLKSLGLHGTAPDERMGPDGSN